jgi:hypothetical protein
MDPSEFPPNSEKSKRGVVEEKNVERITSSSATRRKKSLRKQFSETFVAGDAKSAIRYVIFDVMLPAAKDMIVEAGSQGIEKLIFGDSRRRGSRTPQTGATGYVSYNRYSMQNGPSSSQRAMSRQSRARHNFDEIVLDQRTEAEEVIDRLFDLVSRYDTATVADLYELVGLASTHTDHKWGWTDLHGAGVSRIRGGYLLDLPDPEPID